MSRRAQPFVAALLVLLMGCGRNRVDVSQPIDLVAHPSLSADERAEIVDAAEVWNLEVGTQLRLVAPELAGPQRVDVSFSDYTCAFANGLARMGSSRDVTICSLNRGGNRKATRVLIHEFGHVLNISEHAEDDDAIMGKGRCINETDRKLFVSDNPDYVVPDGCEVTRRLGKHDLATPKVVVPVGSRAVVLWRRLEELSYQVLDDRGAPTGEERAFLSDERREGASSPSVVAVPGGIIVRRYESWKGRERVVPVVARVVLGSQEPPRFVRHGYAHPVLAMIGHGAGVLLAGVEAPEPKEVVLRLFDTKTMEVGPAVERIAIPASSKGLVFFRLARSGVHTFALLDHVEGLEVHRLDGAGRSVERKSYSWKGAQYSVVTATEDAFFVMRKILASPSSGRLRAYELLRVAVGPAGQLGDLRQETIELPEGVEDHTPALAAFAGALWITATVGSPFKSVMVARLSDETLTMEKPWADLGLQDCGSELPALAAVGRRLLAVWAPILDGPARSRCFER